MPLYVLRSCYGISYEEEKTRHILAPSVQEAWEKYFRWCSKYAQEDLIEFLFSQQSKIVVQDITFVDISCYKSEHNNVTDYIIHIIAKDSNLNILDFKISANSHLMMKSGIILEEVDLVD